MSARFFFEQCLEGVAYCHVNGYAHRDIKLENFLVTEDFTVKLADFGLVKDFKSSVLQTYCGTTAYMAPEITGDQPYEGPLVDIFALGVTLYIMLLGAFPFNASMDKDHIKLYTDTQKAFGRTGKNISSQAIKLILAMLQPDAHKRPTIAQIRHSEWMQGLKLS